MTYNILIVDDEKEIGEMLARYLTLGGYHVETEIDPVKALKRVEEGSFSVVITDIMMPLKNGNDLIREIKKVNGFVQVIVITGHVTMNNVLTAFRLGANNCFFKPFESLELIKTEVDLATAKLQRIKSVLHTLTQLPNENPKTGDT